MSDTAKLMIYLSIFALLVALFCTSCINTTPCIDAATQFRKKHLAFGTYPYYYDFQTHPWDGIGPIRAHRVMYIRLFNGDLNWYEPQTGNRISKPTGTKLYDEGENELYNSIH